MRSITFGFSLLEKCFQSLHSYPEPNGLRGFGTVIIALINTIWGLYPFFLKLTDLNTNLEAVLFIIQLFFITLSSCCMSLSALINPPKVFKLWIRLSDFNNYGVPSQLTSIEKRLQITTKISRFVLFFTILFILKESLSDKTCIDGTTSSNTCNFIVQYYVPFQINLWQLSLMALFQMYSGYIICMNCVYGILSYTYIVELLIIRLDDLINKIKEIKFEMGQKNIGKLKHTIKYHQHIVCLFKEVSSFMNKFLPLKVLLLGMIALSVVRITLKHYASGIGVFTLTITLLFLTNTIGQRIINKSSFVSEAIYDLNWYDADVSLQKDVLIFLGASQQPLVMKLILFGSVSYPTMTDETKKIYVWFNWIMKFVFKKG